VAVARSTGLPLQIDVHAHYLVPEYVQQLHDRGGNEVDTTLAREVKDARADLDAREAAMAAAGMDAQILSLSTLQPYVSKRADATALARLANDGYAQLVRGHPRRFAAFAALPLPHVDAALAELERCLDQPEYAGVGITTSILGRSPADPAFDPVWRELDRRRSVLFIHPAGLACGAGVLLNTPLHMTLGGTLEDVLCAMQLFERGFHQRYPNLRVILPHLGGTLPFLLYRLDRTARAWPDDRDVPSIAARKYWYDSVNGTPAALRCACEAYGAERIVLGTDYPYWSGEHHVQAVRYIEQSDLPSETVDRILRRNAAALFAGRFAS
jgi:predicted TIM-barrel fold metal-dependent hydrolase